MARRPFCFSGPRGFGEQKESPMPTVKELREKRATLVEQANGILKKAHDDKREGLPTEDDQLWHRLHDEADLLKRHFEMLEKQEKIEKELAEPQQRMAEVVQVRPVEERRDPLIAMR